MKRTYFILKAPLSPFPSRLARKQVLARYGTLLASYHPNQQTFLAGR